ncbi:MAG: M28 family peptidase [Phycisphaerales bacterium]
MRSFRRTLLHIFLVYLIPTVGVGSAQADIVQEAVDRVSLGQYRVYQVDIQDMGLGLYGGPDYDQGYRNRDGWAYGVARIQPGWTEAGTLGNLEARLYLADQFAAMGLEVEVQGLYRNIVAELRGTQRPEDIYIICAHYDTTTSATSERPGGDDNASGTAGVLEAARVLSRYDPNCTLRFIGFNAEEDWMLGSQEYVNTVVVAGQENVVGVLNLDMILRPGFDGDPLAPIDLDIVTDLTRPGFAAWAYTFIDAIATYAPSLPVDSATPISQNWSASDQGPFISAGYPALMIAENTAADIWYGNSNAYYHKPDDASDGAANDPLSPSGITYDYGFATDVVRASVATLAREAGIVAKAAPDFVEFQSLPTTGALDIEPFTIGDDSYIAIANSRNDLTYDVNVTVHKWDGNDFVEVQSIPGHGASDCEFLDLGRTWYLMIASLRDDATYEGHSTLYRWNGTAFAEVQSIPTVGAADCEFFAIGDSVYLAVASGGTDATSDVGCMIYRLDGTSFDPIQLIMTHGARDCEFFTIGSDSFLAIANGRTDTTYNVDSHIFRWDGTQFVEFQAIATQGAADWEFFTIGDGSFLAVANGYDDVSYSVDSRLYKWDGTSFVTYQFMPTYGAADWESFSIGDDSYLAVANGYDGVTRDIDSTVYKWNGARFVESLTIPTHGASDLAFFTTGPASFLAAANSRNDATTGVASVVYRYSVPPADDPGQ